MKGTPEAAGWPQLAFEERAVESDMTELRVLLRGE